jgi:hypothetical protein
MDAGEVKSDYHESGVVKRHVLYDFAYSAPTGARQLDDAAR